ncbi:MAG: tRNA (N6-isopentenyl adenosine(37)-C2)-methylthiotransferase MiaB, partial [Clostridia bacterium]
MFYKIVTYGCQMNVHESEKIAGLLNSLGYTDAGENAADIVVFNTCCIRDTAESRAFGNIGVIKHEKEKNPNLIIAVVGCMTQQDGVADKIKERYPYVDIVLGTRNIASLSAEIANVLDARLVKRKNDKKYRCFDTVLPENYLQIDEKTPQLRTSFPNAWINIIYGCNNFCTYCIVPYVRGRELSRNMESVVGEVKNCVDNGYREITLLGQNVNSFGNDLDDKNINFATLLNKIDKIDGKFRVRFMTSHPKDLNDEIIDAMANSSKICKNLHLPIQAGSNKVLTDMNRRYTREHYLNIIEKLRHAMPNIGITTDIMVGFPTETEDDFLQTLEIVKEVRYSAAFTFIYSPRGGTPAAAMTQLPYSVKQERIERLISCQNEITRELSNEYLGKTFEVLAEDVAPKRKHMLCGRTDSGRLVTFDGNATDIGKFFDVKVEEARSA